MILLDFGAVLVGLDKQRCINALQQVGLDSIASYVDEHRSEDLFHRIELGGSSKEFCDEARRRSSGNPTDEEVEWAWGQLLTGIPNVLSDKTAHHHVTFDGAAKLPNGKQTLFIGPISEKELYWSEGEKSSYLLFTTVGEVPSSYVFEE